MPDLISSMFTAAGVVAIGLGLYFATRGIDFRMIFTGKSKRG